MTDSATRAPARRDEERFVMDASSGDGDACLVVFGGIHGDEPGGVRALERVGRQLSAARIPVRGRLVGVRGNLSALSAGVRYLDRDLNRNWYEETVAELRARDTTADTQEDREARALVSFLDSLEAENRSCVFLDLHSTSADGLPFACMPDTLTNLRLALELPIPSILGLEETINGPLLGLLSDRGYRGVIVEGGKHDHPETVDILESCVWVLVVALRLVRPDQIPDYGTHWNRLAELGQGLPRVMEITHRHETHADDGFVMHPGYEHYQPVVVGEQLARDRTGEIRSPKYGRIIMPAYKGGSDQGFFIVRDIPPLYVWILVGLRKLRLGRYAHWLPGARLEPDNPNLLHVASWVPGPLVNIIRLLGWRRTQRFETHTVLRRRRVRR